MRYRAYEEVEPLDTRALFSLLNIGDAQERVWASWALGLRLDKRLIPALSKLVRTDRAGGTRRHQTVMLASFGAAETVRAVALTDQDDRVRGTALGLMTRFAEPDDDFTYDLLMERLLREEPAAQLEIVRALRDDAPGYVVQALQGLDRNDDPVVRRTSADKRAHLDANFSQSQRLRSPFETNDFPLLVINRAATDPN